MSVRTQTCTNSMWGKIGRQLATAATVIVATAASAIAPAVAQGEGPIIVVSGPLSWPFFGAVKKGFDDASKAFGLDYQYVAVTDTANMSSEYPRLLQQAISRKPKMLLVGEFFPEGMDALVKEATAAGIPVYLHNSGQFYWKDNGALGFVGEDPHQMGYAAGELHAAKGVKHGMCFNHVPGNPTVEERCKGYEEAMAAAGGKTTTLTVGTGDSTNLQAMAQAIKGGLQATPDIDAIFTLGADPAVSAVTAVKDLSVADKVRIGTTDSSSAVMEAIKAGEIEFSMDQQPYLQGFISMQVAYQYLTYGLYPVGAISTGPLVVDANNIEKVLEINSKHPGVLGAF